MQCLCVVLFDFVCHIYIHTPHPSSRSSVTEQVRVAELELTAAALRDTLREKEKEIEGSLKEIRKQHADRLR